MCFVYTIFPKNSDCKSTNYFLTKNFFLQLIFNIRKLIIFRVFHVAQTNKNVSLQGQILIKDTAPSAADRGFRQPPGAMCLVMCWKIRS